MKIVVPLTVAAYLSEELLPPHIKIILISFLITLIPCFLIFMQPDLGTSILIASSGFFCNMVSRSWLVFSNNDVRILNIFVVAGMEFCFTFISKTEDIDFV